MIFPTDLTTHPSSRESITSSLMLVNSPSNSSHLIITFNSTDLAGKMIRNHLSAFSSVQSKATTNFSSWASLASSASSTAWRVSCPAMLPRQMPRSRSLPSIIPSANDGESRDTNHRVSNSSGNHCHNGKRKDF